MDAKFRRLEKEAKTASNREKLACDMEEKAKEREIIAKRREERQD